MSLIIYYDFIEIKNKINYGYLYLIFLFISQLPVEPRPELEPRQLAAPVRLMA